MGERTCQLCGKQYEGITNNRYCSKECTQRAEWAREHPAHAPDGLYHGMCLHCGERFTSERKRKYCCRECMIQHTYEVAHEQRAVRTCRYCGAVLSGNKRVYCSALCKREYEHTSEAVRIDDDIIKKRVAERYPMLGYLGGYTGGGGYITLRCKVCNKEFQWLERSARKDYASGCPHCAEDAREKEREREQAKSLAIKRASVIRRLVKNAREEQSRMRRCVICGNKFRMEQGRTCCSDECKRRLRRLSDRNSRHARRVRVRSCSEKIWLKDVYDRDSGVCYICGTACSYEDRRIMNGYFVAGDRYPTVDHVVPLSKGGTHTHDNVRLACMKCNREKGDKTTKAVEKSLQLF